ncbi:hypothetical protein NHX12_022901 [Muraenolepis orangiensis]|uniref:Uncharacterized protein n=1 Tax=Muraenolepis orangiensis TaxID=630683 RepID=A0A9Q0IUH5_9TELE|nr:hypothetical protein NHX12_022901 [Muraenolepis orangiensis]
MNLVEKRHSSRRSSGHRKHSDGGYSDTSSGGSFLDEMDREVRNLTDRAFRSLCIGDEAIYNDSDLSASSPSMQTERQQAFCQSGQDWNREKMKRGAQESYGLQLQQYGQEWTHEMGETQGDTCWAGNVDGRTVGQESATFQHALMDGSLHQRTSVNKEPLSLLSNGAREFGTHERRSRSRVSTLIKAFNSDGYRDGAGPDSKLMEQNNDANWDKSALMSIQREISEISTAYGQNLNSGPFSPAGPFSPQESYYSSQVATAQIDSSSSSSFMRSSHSQHSMSSLYSSSSNVFVHSEFSPFRVWQAHERFPFQHGDVSGYMHSSDFQKWYETPLYEELSLGPETHHVPMHEQWVAETPLRKPLEHVTSPPVPRSSSTSSVLHKASAVQKRCESESAEFHNMRKRTRSLGTNRLPPQQSSTVSPTNEISRPGQDTTLNSITDLQHKFKMMTSEQSVATEMMGNMHGILYSSDHFTQFTNSNTATIMAGEQFVDSNTRTTPFNMNHSHMPGSYPHQDVRTSEVHQCVLSPPAMEHPPVRAESRGGTPDIRLSSYKTRATSLLFNLKDNRKRVKSTYSPPKFKGRENFDRNKPCIRNDCIEPRDTVINIPEFQDSDLQVPQVMVQQGPSVGSHLTQAYGVQCNNISGDYLAPPTQTGNTAVKTKRPPVSMTTQTLNVNQKPLS